MNLRKIWRNAEGQFHRTDGPAVEWANGSKYWYLEGVNYTEEEFLAKMSDQPEVDEVGTKRWKNAEGQLHRDDGPAIEHADGSKEWWVEDKLHRLDGPAIEYVNGDKSWFLNSKLHRTDGPAIECANGDKFWYVEGKRHRTDGPAVEYANGDKFWYLEGKKYSEEEFLAKMSNQPKIDTNETLRWHNAKGQFHRLDGPALEYANGDKEWFLNGKRHRTDGPAIDCVDGDKEWFVEGKRHRTDGPAVECADGTKEWFVKGKHHRTDGPAIEYANGSKEWCLEGVEYTEEEFQKKMSVRKDVRNNNMSDNSVKYGKKNLVSDAGKASLRQVGRKSTKALQAGIVHLMRKQGLSDTDLQGLVKAMNTEAGRAALSGLLGLFMFHIKQDSNFVQSLGEEYRVSAIDSAMESGAAALYEKVKGMIPLFLSLAASLDSAESVDSTLDALSKFDTIIPSEIQEELNSLDQQFRVADESTSSSLEEVEAEEETEAENIQYNSCA